MSGQWIEINGVRLRYAYSASKAKPARGTIVLVHEMGGAIETFDDIVPALEGEWNVLRYDQRGSGLSEKTRGTLDIDTLAEDLAALMKALGIAPRITLVACALGAAVAVQFAARHPTYLASMVLMSPATAIPKDRRDWVHARADAIERQGVRAAIGNEGGHGSELNRHEILRLVSDPGSLASYWRMLANLDLDESLAAIACPVLVLAGEHDKVRYPARVQEEVASKIPNAVFKAIESGHVMPAETPELAVAVLTDYLAGQGS